jgi:hypothetical protein
MLRSVLRNTVTLTRLSVHDIGYHYSILPQNPQNSMFILTRAFATTHSSASPVVNNPNLSIPEELLNIKHPKPVRHEIVESKKPLDTKALENIDIKMDLHRQPVTLSDKLAFRIVKLLRLPTDWFFKKKYIHRAVMLETVSRMNFFILPYKRCCAKYIYIYRLLQFLVWSRLPFVIFVL